MGAQVEHPSLRQPVTLIVDDPNPGYNPAYFHSGFRNGPMFVPRTLVDEFADLVEACGIRGKFSVIPNPFGLGRIDQDLQGVSRADLHYFLDVVRSRIAPYLDITPEVLTHWNALDLATGQLLPYWEHVWSRSQDRTTLEPYLTLALQILENVDLPCAGMTSPWDFGDGVEIEYAEALLAAQRALYGNTFTWYFLQMDATSPQVAPHRTVFRPESHEAVVGIVACDAFDFGYAVWHGGAPAPDLLISADGASGRLVEVLNAGGPAAFHTHWQTLFSQGTRSGLHALRAVADRLADHYGERIVWTRCADLARYAAVAASVDLAPLSETPEQLVFQITAPFPCPGFTLSLDLPHAVRTVRVAAAPLSHASDPSSLREGFYLQNEGRLTLCWALQDSQHLVIDLQE